MKNWTRRAMLSGLLTIAVTASAPAQQATKISVFKSPTCTCCSKWVEHLRTHGFAPTATNVDNMDAIKTKHNVPRAAQSCHTAIVGGYVIEGHVPAADIQRLLKERPAVVGIAAPGMPIGSPGMEGPSPDKYDVVTFDKQGKTRVFATHGR